MSTLKC